MPSKDFAPEELSAPVTGIVAGVAVILGIVIASFGFWLAWRPLGFIAGGMASSAVGVLLGRRAQRSARRQS
jgi:hypothetical protein